MRLSETWETARILARNGLEFVRGMLSRVRAHRLIQAAPFWLAAVATGLVAVSYARAFNAATSFAQSVLATHPYVLLAFTPVCFVAGWLLVHRGSPGAAGSGIPQVMTLLQLDPVANDTAFARLVGWRVMLVKVVSSLCCALGGGAVGREGPMIQISASIFHAVGAGFRRLIPAPNHHGWIVTGGAAGIAAAFNTPLGGIVFAVEELASSGFTRFKTHLITAVIISGMVAQTFLGPYLLFGYPAVGDLSPLKAIVLALFVGVVCGFGGGLFGKTLGVATAYLRVLPSRQRALVTAGAGVLVAGIAILQGPFVLGGGVELVKEFLFVPESHGTWPLLVARYVSTVLSYLAGCAGGIFAPSLALGGTLGSVLDGIVDSGNANLMILLGMVAFLSAVTRAPFTAFVLVEEMTDRHSAIFPLMLASIFGAMSAHIVDPVAFYHQQRRFFAGWFKDAVPELRPELRSMTVASALTPVPAVLAPHTKLEEVVRIAIKSGQTCIPVVSDTGFHGIVVMDDVRNNLDNDELLSLVVAGDVMRTGVVTVETHDTLDVALRKLLDSKLHAIPVMSADVPAALAGWLTQGDILRALAHHAARPATGEIPVAERS